MRYALTAAPCAAVNLPERQIYRAERRGCKGTNKKRKDREKWFSVLDSQKRRG